MTEGELCVFPRAAFERVLEDHQRMERLLLQRTFESLNEARGRMLVLARKSAGGEAGGLPARHDGAGRGPAGARPAATGR